MGPDDHGSGDALEELRKMNPARLDAHTRKLLGNDPGAKLITLAAFLAFLLSVTLWFTDSREEALFTGLWVPSILAVGAFYAALRRR
ncbi:MAG TPA: hypothetical protein VFM57_14780 [Thermoleophilaceae bacterium]|nr:hypothetical protein [Thermoleophilaceae bacterium]